MQLPFSKPLFKFPNLDLIPLLLKVLIDYMPETTFYFFQN